MVSPVTITNTFNGDISAANYVNAAALDTQLTNLASTINSEIAERQRTVRDGSGLASQVVRFPSLHPEVTALLTSGGLIPKQAVAAVAISNVGSLSGLQVIDSYTLLANDRVLLVGQSNPINNGLWVAAAGAWTRPSDSANNAVLSIYTFVTVIYGTIQTGSSWYLTAAATVSVAAQSWVIYSSGGILPIVRGGTGASDAATARTNLGLGSLAILSSVTQASLASDVQYRVDTIAALKALTVTYNSVLVLGYYAAGDGGGGTFRWNSSDTSSDNLGTVIIPNSAPGAGRWNLLHDGSVSVLQFGADGTGTLDSFAAFQSAATLAKGSDGTGDNKKVTRIHIPTPLNAGFYKITDTIVFDGIYGLHIYGNRALSKRSLETVRWYGASSKPIFQFRGETVVNSNPNANITIENLSMQGESTKTAAGGTPSATCALAGVYIGNLNGVANATSNYTIRIVGCQIYNCRFGIYSGSPGGANTDHPDVEISGCSINNNFQAGVRWGTGNAIGRVIGGYFGGNGWAKTNFAADNYSAQIGANIYVASGQLHISDYTSAGAGSSKPVDADIYQASGSVNINKAWSDTEGYFFYQASGSSGGGANYISYLSAIRHYSGTFTAGNTPNSLNVSIPGTVVNGAMLYGNCVVTSGLSGKPTFIGVNFAGSSTFTGTGVDTQRSIVAIQCGPGNNPLILTGGRNSGVSLATVGYLPPRVLHTGVECIEQLLGPASADCGWTSYFNVGTGGIDYCSNCYQSSAGNFKAFKTGPATVFRFSAESGYLIYGYDFPDTTSAVALGSFTLGSVELGGTSGYSGERTYRPPLRSGAPSFNSGDYWAGSLYYDTTTKRLRVNFGTTVWQDVVAVLTGSATIDAASIANGAAGTIGTVTVTGAVLGDVVVGVSCSLDIQGLQLTGAVTAANTVTIRARNDTGGAVDLASATYRARVQKQ
jgi:hypothetical protein